LNPGGSITAEMNGLQPGRVSSHRAKGNSWHDPDAPGLLDVGT